MIRFVLAMLTIFRRHLLNSSVLIAKPSVFYAPKKLSVIFTCLSLSQGSTEKTSRHFFFSVAYNENQTSVEKGTDGYSSRTMKVLRYSF